MGFMYSHQFHFVGAGSNPADVAMFLPIYYAFILLQNDLDSRHGLTKPRIQEAVCASEGNRNARI